jgi:hypothetical protein
MQKIDEEGLVGIYEKSDPDLLLHFGSRLYKTRVPEGSRILFPRPPVEDVGDLRAAVEHALDHPHGTDPFNTLLRPGMKVTIAIDDLSLPEPKMKSPDVRAVVIDALMDRLREHGIDDVHIVIAVCMHRHMHDWEVKEMLGRRIFNAFWPDRLYNYDCEDPDDNIVLGHTDEGLIVEMHKRSATSHLLIYVNITMIALNGGHKSVGNGLGTYRTVRQHHEVHHNMNSCSFNDLPRSKLHETINKIGRYINQQVNVFHIETTMNSETFPKIYGFMEKQETDWNAWDKVNAFTTRSFLATSPLAFNRKLFFANKAPYKVTSIQAGETDVIHPTTIENVYKQQLIKIEGQSDIYVIPIPYMMPYSIHSIMNPILVYAMGLGYMFNFYKNQPVVKKGGTVIFLHPMEHKFDPVHHPSYIGLWEKMAENNDPVHIDRTYADEFAKDERYIELYRFHNAFHGFHSISMSNWGAHGRDWAGQVIAVNPYSQEVPRRLGWDTAPTLMDAIAMARDRLGQNASVSVCHSPPIAMWEVV